MKIRLDWNELSILTVLKYADKTIWFQKFKKYIKNHYPEYDPLKEKASIRWTDGEVTFNSIEK